MARMSALVAGTFDTKGAELGYIAERLRAAGVATKTVDLSTGGAGCADVTAAEVAACHPGGAGAVLRQHDRGAAVSAMAVAFEAYVRKTSGITGLIGAGGSGGTSLVAPAMRILDVGVPKILVSTVANGNVGPYVGASDIAMIHSVTDVQGLNRISRRVLGNAAHALAGMILNMRSIPGGVDNPAVGLTMFGVTTRCVGHLAAALADTNDPVVFHATGTGGQSMEKLVESGLIGGVIDLTTTEIADMLVGGVFAATDDRMGAVIRTGVPYVGSVGALDMVNFGARDTVPERFAGRLLHAHNPQVTLMRTTPEENRAFGAWIATRLNAMPGPVRFLLPEGGVSALDAPGKVFHDTQADAALFEAVESGVRDHACLIRVPYNLDTAAFADVALGAYREIS